MSEPKAYVLKEPPQEIEDAAADVINCGLRGHRFRRPELNLCVRCGMLDAMVATHRGRGRRVLWTAKMDASLLRIRVEGGSFADVAKAAGVSIDAARYRVWHMSCRPAVVGMRLLLNVAADRHEDEADARAIIDRAALGEAPHDA